MIFDNNSLLAADAVILLMLAATFLMAAHRRWEDRFWYSWAAGNFALGSALPFYMAQHHLPALVIAAVPNGLLLLGFGLRWRAAREFGRRPVIDRLVYGPALVFAAACLVPAVLASYDLIFILANVFLTVLSFACAWEFFRDRRDGLLSRYGLVLCYAGIGTSFAMRIVQGIVFGGSIEDYLPDDTMLTVHLLAALFFSLASGLLALSIAYERDALRLREAAMRDGLTELLNRQGFESEAARLLAGRDGTPYALIVFDIDHFKAINDRFGHPSGDAALRRCAAIFRTVLNGRGPVARIGGEEFATLVAGASRTQAFIISEGLREAVKATEVVAGSGQRFGLTISVGVCTGTIGVDTLSSLMQRADEGLYAAKQAGRDRVAGSAA